MSTKTQNLMEALLEEMNRVRELIKEYEDPILKGAGFLAAHIMKTEIQMAEKAIAEGDTIEMMVWYSKLKENKA